MTSALSQDLRGKLALGTAQFGLAYGISNKQGRVPPAEVAIILREATGSGVRTIDTAEGYGDSERIIGSAIAELQHEFEIVTKFPAGLGRDSLGEHLAGSLARLGVASLNGYLAHDPHSLLDAGIVDALCEAQERGLVQRFGASVYHPSEIEKYLERDIDFSLVQLPYSIVDQRFASLLPELAKRDVRVHVRSLFLQGLLLMEPDQVPTHLSRILPAIAWLRDEAAAIEVPPQTLLLGIGLLADGIDRVVVGVTSVEEFRMNVSALELVSASQLDLARLRSVALEEESIILPSRWLGQFDEAL